jgi:rubrerythrin
MLAMVKKELKVGMADAAGDHLREKDRTRTRAQKLHQGRRHWHVNARSAVIVCRACGAKVPRSLNPQFCPECGSGEDHLSSPN